MANLMYLLASFISIVSLTSLAAWAILRLLHNTLKTPRQRMLANAAALLSPLLAWAAYLLHTAGCPWITADWSWRLCTLIYTYRWPIILLGAGLSAQRLRHWVKQMTLRKHHAVLLQESTNTRHLQRLHPMLQRLGAGSQTFRVHESFMPFAYVQGILRPTLILSSSLLELLEDDELESVLAHEVAHLKGKDNWFNLVFLVHELAWFSPWIKGRYKAFCQAREEAADDVANLLTGAPLNLASALVKVERRNQGMQQLLGTQSWLHGQNDTLERIERLVDWQEPHRSAEANNSLLYMTVALGPVLLGLLC